MEIKAQDIIPGQVVSKKNLGDVIVNELGNTIRFSVTKDSENVTVFASGPHSEVEHEWTRLEAEVLRDLLTEILSD